MFNIKGEIKGRAKHYYSILGKMRRRNINFEELATLAATSGISSINNFLWNDEEEDEDTLWTKISDPDN